MMSFLKILGIIFLAGLVFVAITFAGMTLIFFLGALPEMIK